MYVIGVTEKLFLTDVFLGDCVNSFYSLLI